MGEAQNHSLRELAPPGVQLEITQRLFGERTPLHPSAQHGLLDGLTALHPDPVRGPRDESARRLVSVADLPGELQEASRADGYAGEIDLVGQLNGTEHASIEPKKDAPKRNVPVSICERGAAGASLE